MSFVCKHELPKIWMGRIQKYWDKILPSDIPVSSSSFSTTFKSEAAVAAVTNMENEVNTEACIAVNAIPENTVVSGYVGVYEVEGTPGELTLLCPDRVSSNNVVAMHYNEEADTWENIENIQIIDGYVWGTLDSFSPIAVFEYRPAVVFMEGPIENVSTAATVVVANGNPVKVYTDEEGKIMLEGPDGKATELTAKTFIIGGSIDGTPVETTSVTLKGVNNKNIITGLCGGSNYLPTEEVPFTTVGTVNVNIIDSKLAGTISGSIGAVRTTNTNIKVSNSTVYGLGTSQSYINKTIGDINKLAGLGFGSRSWDLKSNVVVENNSKVTLLFVGGNSGYTYTKEGKSTVDNSFVDYYIFGGGSNGRTDSAECVVTNSHINVFQTVNRGSVGTLSAKVDKCVIDNFYIGGETADKTVTGTTEKVKYVVGAGTYNLVPGTDGGVVIANNDILDSFRISRAAEVTITPEFASILGNKYIIK